MTSLLSFANIKILHYGYSTDSILLYDKKDVNFILKKIKFIDN
jgi:hypothetical protein